jgi:hypothetical protein
MRSIILVGLFGLLLWCVGSAVAGSVCPTCADLNYDCVPDNYVYDGCPIAPSTCPFTSCNAHCQGLLGSSASGSCSTTLFACICETGSSVGTTDPPVTSGSSVAPVSKTPSNGNSTTTTTTTTTHSGGVSTTTVSIAALDWSTIRLNTNGTIVTGLGQTVSLVLVAAVCAVVILMGIVAYAAPTWVRKGDKNMAQPVPAMFWS